MRIICLTATLTMLLFLSVATIAQPTAGGVKEGSGEPDKVLNKAKYETAIKTLIGDKVKGYQAVLVKGGKPVSDLAGGIARNAIDGQMDMSSSTPQDIGSLQKFITGVAMLNLMVKKSQWGPSRDNSLTQGLDTRIYTLFPQVWLDNIGPVGVRDITIRKLLQHRSGFDDQFGGERTMMGFIKDGWNTAQWDNREYSNINFVATGYLLPIYEHGQIKNDLNNLTSGQVPIMADSNARERLGQRMNEIFYERMFNKMAQPIKPSCDAPVEMKNTLAYGYTSRTDEGKGKTWSQRKTSGHCAGQGGYYMSARDLANFVAHVHNTDIILNQEARDLMLAKANRLTTVWSGLRRLKILGSNRHSG